MRSRHRNRLAAATFVDSCLAVGQVGFTLTRLTKATGLSPIAAAAQLSRLEPAVVRLYPRSNYFLIVPPEHRANGAPPVLWWLDNFFATQREPYYVGLLSAAAHYGASHQATQATQVVTAHPRRDIAIGRLTVTFVMKRTMNETPLTELAGGHAPVKLSSPEATLLDLLRYADKMGGIERVAQVIADLRPKLSVAGFHRALESPLETALLQRCGYLLEALGMDRFSRMVADKLTDRRLYLIPLSGDAIEPKDQHNAWNVYGTLGVGADA